MKQSLTPVSHRSYASPAQNSRPEVLQGGRVPTPPLLTLSEALDYFDVDQRPDAASPAYCGSLGLDCHRCVKNVAQHVRETSDTRPKPISHEEANRLFRTIYPAPGCDPMRSRFVRLVGGCLHCRRPLSRWVRLWRRDDFCSNRCRKIERQEIMALAVKRLANSK